MSKTARITILENGKIQIAAYDCALGRVAKATLDLASHAGETVRIWLEPDKKYSLDKIRDHYWQVAELPVLPQLYRDIEGEPDSEGHPALQREAIPLDLTGVGITVWNLPE